MAPKSREGLVESSARFAAAVSFMIGGVSVFACGSNGTSSPPAPAAPPAPTACQKTDRAGTYLLTWTEHAGGTCGTIMESLVSFNAPVPTMTGDGGVGSTCTVHSDVWSENDCKNERTFTCVTKVSDSTQPGGFGTGTVDYVAVTRQETVNGSTVDGLVTVRLDYPTQACSGTYSVRYVRQ